MPEACQMDAGRQAGRANQHANWSQLSDAGSYPTFSFLQLLLELHLCDPIERWDKIVSSFVFHLISFQVSEVDMIFIPQPFVNPADALAGSQKEERMQALENSVTAGDQHFNTSVPCPNVDLPAPMVIPSGPVRICEPGLGLDSGGVRASGEETPRFRRPHTPHSVSLLSSCPGTPLFFQTGMFNSRSYPQINLAIVSRLSLRVGEFVRQMPKVTSASPRSHWRPRSCQGPRVWLWVLCPVPGVRYRYLMYKL